MSLDIAGILDGIASHAASLGYFERVNMHEPKRDQAGAGLVAAVWVQKVGPVKSSGLASTTGRLEFTVRLYLPMLTEPQDMIDPAVIEATSALIAAYSGDFTLGARVRKVDLLGAFGVPLSAEAGYLAQDGRLFRVMDITLPLIVDDIWDQEA